MIINRRKLIRLIISEIYSEKPYFDFKEKIDLSSTRGKGQLVRSIAALANANLTNRAYLIFGISDNRKIIGVKTIDDQQIQQLVRNYLSSHLKVSYENVPFPYSASSQNIGLLIIYPAMLPVKITKDIWKLKKGDIFVRQGSESIKTSKENINGHFAYKNEIEALEQKAAISLKECIDGVLEFYNKTDKLYNPQHVVFNDQHIICFSAWEEEEEKLLSEVYIEFINEGIRFFWSALEWAKIAYNENEFKITKYLQLFWNTKTLFIPYSERIITFLPNGKYNVNTNNIFIPPEVSTDEINQLISFYNSLTINNINNDNNLELFARLEILPYELLIAILNGSTEAKKIFENFLDGNIDGAVAESYIEAKRIFQELKTLDKIST